MPHVNTDAEEADALAKALEWAEARRCVVQLPVELAAAEKAGQELLLVYSTREFKSGRRFTRHWLTRKRRSYYHYEIPDYAEYVRQFCKNRGLRTEWQFSADQLSLFVRW